MPYFDQDIDRLTADWIAAADAFLLGRRTYEFFASAPGDVAGEVARLKCQPGGEPQVHGSAAHVRTLMKHGAVDEYRLLIHSVVLGDGKRLFAGGATPAALGLIATKPTSRGVVAHVYQPPGSRNTARLPPGKRVTSSFIEAGPVTGRWPGGSG